MTSVAPPSPGAWVVLGLLLDGPPRSGYELQALAARSVAHFWPVTKAHVYSELPRLEAHGYVRGEDVPQDGAPDKRVYAATAAGREAFASWLAAADLGTPRLRHPLLLTVFFGAALPASALATTLDRYEAELGALRAEYAALAAPARGRSAERAAALRRLTIRSGIQRIDADLALIAEVRATLGRRRKGGH